MGVLSDKQITELAAAGMIVPFAEGQKRLGTISYGTSSYGYDVRCGYVFRVFSPINATVIDPKAFDSRALVEIDLTPPPEGHDFNGTTNRSTCKWCGVYFDNPNSKDLSWKDACEAKKRSLKPNYILIPPHSFVLAESIETFNIPRDILVVVLGKSTYARCGLVVNVTPGEPEWVGKWTIEISNTTPLPAKVYCGEGVMQALFLRADEVCQTSYKDRSGKYQGQTGLTLPKTEGQS